MGQAVLLAAEEGHTEELLNCKRSISDPTH